MSRWNPEIARAKRTKRIKLALRAALAEKADIYHFHDPELISIGLALKVLRPSASVIYDVHEDYPAMMLVKHWLPKPLRPLLARTARLANITAGLCLDGIVTADPSVQKDFHRVAANKNLVFYNFPTLSLFKTGKDDQSKTTSDLVYIGGMSSRTGMFVLLDALVLLSKQDIRVTARLAGYTDDQAGLVAIEDRIRSQGLTGQVEVSGRIPHSQVPAWIRSGRIGLVPLQPIAKFMKNIPTKMFEYWACGLPVIASDLPPIRQFLSNGKNGVIFNPSSSQDLARAIRSLVEWPNRAEAMGQYGQQQVYLKWNNEAQIDALTRFYNQISSKWGHVDTTASDQCR
jgi:glycosyltransferase involved in cell wall biosynthesis